MHLLRDLVRVDTLQLENLARVDVEVDALHGGVLLDEELPCSLRRVLPVRVLLLEVDRPHSPMVVDEFPKGGLFLLDRRDHDCVKTVRTVDTDFEADDVIAARGQLMFLPEF